ncbi:MAG: hypothetical protein ACRD0U_04650, partial [Acidimicrobiales bacterium]
MTSRTAGALLLGLSLTLVGLAGCGDDDDVIGVGGSTTVVGDTTTTVADETTTTTAKQEETTVVPPSPPIPATSFAELALDVNDGSAAKQATLSCGDTPAGTGYLADAAAAAAACDLLRDNVEARERLVKGA